jgi:hypothetical protein
MTSRTHTPEDVKKIDDEFKAVLTTKFFKEKKEWVGLTDEEVWHMSQFNCGTRGEFARAIEAKLKEKNT